MLSEKGVYKAFTRSLLEESNSVSALAHMVSISQTNTGKSFQLGTGHRTKDRDIPY